MKKLVSLFILLLFSSNSLFSQGYQKDLTWIGPTLGLGFGNLAFGAQAEYGITENIGLGLDLGYSSFSEDFGGLTNSEFQYSLFGVLAGASYHFTPNKKFDPYLKLGMGYFNWGFKYIEDGKEVALPFGQSSAYTSGVAIGGQIGARYHFNELVSARAALGYPFLLSVGVDYAIGEPTITNENTIVTEKPKTENSIKSGNEAKESYPFYIGAYVGAKASFNTAIPTLRSQGVAFGVPEAGVSFLLPFSRTGSTGIQLDLGYSATSYSSKPKTGSNDSNTITENYSYFNITPSFNLGGFVLGLNFGLPISAKAMNDKDKEANIIYNGAIHNPFGVTIDPTDYMATIIEIKLGGAIPLVTNESGRLTLNILASYNFSGVYEKASVYSFAYDEEFDPKDPFKQIDYKESLNPKPVSLSIGISYLFNVTN